MMLRKANKATDYDKIWKIFSVVIKTGDTYVFDLATPKADLDKYWFANYMETFVAINDQEDIIGSYILKPNQIGLGNHIAHCSYMVNPRLPGTWHTPANVRTFH